MMQKQLAINGGTPVRPGKPIPASKVCFDEEERTAVKRVFDSGVFCSVFDEAVEVPMLEKEFAQSVGSRHCAAFHSGTTAQHAALAALEIGPGDEVIVPPLTFISTAYTVLIAGAVPVFADVRPDTFIIDPGDILKKITSRTKAVVPVHWLGNAANMNEIMAIASKHGIPVIEDCAHGPGITYQGRQVGSFGSIACWSMQQSKMFTAAGEGGLATTNDQGLAERLRQVRNHGKEKTEKKPADFIAPYRITRLGNNYRLSEIHAAFARAQLQKLPRMLELRRRAYGNLREKISNIRGIGLQNHSSCTELSCYTFPVTFSREFFGAPIEQISAALYAEGIENYPIGLYELCHVHPLFAEETGRSSAAAFFHPRTGTGIPAYGAGTLPVAEAIAGELIMLPMYPDLSADDIDCIALAVEKVAEAYHAANNPSGEA